MATSYPWFPFYAADWTLSVIGMSAVQRGILEPVKSVL